MPLRETARNTLPDATARPDDSPVHSRTRFAATQNSFDPSQNASFARSPNFVLPRNSRRYFRPLYSATRFVLVATMFSPSRLNTLGYRASCRLATIPCARIGKRGNRRHTAISRLATIAALCGRLCGSASLPGIDRQACLGRLPAVFRQSTKRNRSLPD